MLEDTIFDTKLAIKTGIIGAIIIRKLMSWEKYHENNRDRYEEHHFREGKWWVYQTFKAWGKEMPFITDRSIKTNIKNLRDSEWIFVGDLSTDRFRRANYYAVNWDKIRAALSEETSPTEGEETSQCHEEETSQCHGEETSQCPLLIIKTHNLTDNPEKYETAPSGLSVAKAPEESTVSNKISSLQSVKNVEISEEDYELADKWLAHEFIVRPHRIGKKGVHREKFALDVAKARRKMNNLPGAFIEEILKLFASGTPDGKFWSSVCQSPASLLDVLPSSKKRGEDKRKIEALIELITPELFVETRKFENYSVEEKERIANPFKMS